MKRPMVFEGVVAILIIILMFAMYLMVTGSESRANSWEVKINQPVWDVYAGDDGTLYAFAGPTGNTICALDGHGDLKWKLQVPEQWRVLNTINQANIPAAGEPQDPNPAYTSTIIRPVYGFENGTLYVYLRENRTTFYTFYPWETVSADQQYWDQLYWNGQALEERLLAISPDGKILWNVSLAGHYLPLSYISLDVMNGRIYAFSSCNLTVLDRAGSILYRLDNLSDPPSVDENGFIYASSGNLTGPANLMTHFWYRGYKPPSGTIVAYYPNGTVYWTLRVDAPISKPMPDETVCQQDVPFHLPVYQDGTLYLPLRDGLMAIAVNGSILWTEKFDAGRYYLFPSMPIDLNGNVYMEYHMGVNEGTYVKVINKTGHELATFNRTSDDWLAICGDPYEGRFYEAIPVRQAVSDDNMSLEDLTTYQLRAQNLTNGNNEWVYTLQVGNKSSFIINNDTISALDEYAHISYSWVEWLVVRSDNYQYNYWYTAENIAHTAGNVTPRVVPYYPLKMAAGKDAIYVSFFTANYEGPVVLGQSKCVYAGGIYAIGKNGTLLWYKPVDAFAASISGNNGTVYYATRNGEIGAGGMDAIAGGITLAALAYVFVRFFLIGAVARAKGRLGKNENRNSVLKYIADNPGSTLREVSRGLGMNLGTLRYHMFILSLNHRVVPYMADDKHVRYFMNSNAFSMEEQLIISLLRRAGMRRVLGLLLQENPGLSNGELSGRLNMQDSAVSRYVKELVDHGIVEKGQTPEGKTIFSIKDEHKGCITSTIKHIVP